MCGFVGYIGNGPADFLDAAAQSIAHRGPDDSGSYDTETVHFRFRRLSILDLAEGHQPMGSPDGTCAIVFNGEIYNHLELREELLQAGHPPFTTRSDTETLLAAYQTWGADCIPRLSGMFAFAIHDTIKKQILMARDPFGKKPLYLHAAKNGLHFASEIKCLLPHVGKTPTVRTDQIATMLTYRYLPGIETLFDNIASLPPGSYQTFSSLGQPLSAPVIYFRPPIFARPALRQTKSAELLQDFKHHLEAAVQKRLLSDVPFGAFLSGGLDSSVITALMAHQIEGRVKTFSVGFDTGFSEHHHARKVSQHLNTDHHELIISADDLIREIPQVLWARESPISEPSDIALYALCREAQKHVTVVLSGEGADELFAGYPKYQFAAYSTKMPALITQPLATIAHALTPRSRARLRTALSATSAVHPLEGYAKWFGGFSERERRELLQPHLLKDLDHVHVESQKLLSHRSSHQGDGAVEEMQFLDCTTWLPANLLLRGDRITMAHSLELRCPFLDKNLSEYCGEHLRRENRIHGRSGKYILRQIAADLLPPEILQRPKWGFKVPVGQWFRGPLQQSLLQTLCGPQALKRNYYNQPIILRWLDDHISARADHSKQLWILYQIELWHQMFIDQTLSKTDLL